MNKLFLLTKRKQINIMAILVIVISTTVVTPKVFKVSAQRNQEIVARTARLPC